MADEPEAPEQSRPELPESYGVPKSGAGMLPLGWAEERLARALNYWVGTTRPDGRPHAVPVWGVWLDQQFYFEGGPDTRRGRNIAHNPAVVVHIELGEDIVIVEGSAQEIAAPDEDLSARLVDAFASKYLPQHNYRPDPASWQEGGLYTVRPRTVMAWSSFPGDATRWRFGED